MPDKGFVITELTVAGAVIAASRDGVDLGAVQGAGPIGNWPRP